MAAGISVLRASHPAARPAPYLHQRGGSGCIPARRRRLAVPCRAVPRGGPRRRGERRAWPSAEGTPPLARPRSPLHRPPECQMLTLFLTPVASCKGKREGWTLLELLMGRGGSFQGGGGISPHVKVKLALTFVGACQVLQHERPPSACNGSWKMAGLFLYFHMFSHICQNSERGPQEF